MPRTIRLTSTVSPRRGFVWIVTVSADHMRQARGGIGRDAVEVLELARRLAVDLAGDLVVRAFAEHDQLQLVGGNGEGVHQAIDQAEHQHRGAHQQAGEERRHERRHPADAEVAEVVFDGDHLERSVAGNRVAKRRG